MKKLILASIRLYQKYLSFYAGPACRFNPQCSEYNYQAIDKYGILHGSWLGLKRIIRCHPWSKGGPDQIPN